MALIYHGKCSGNIRKAAVNSAWNEAGRGFRAERILAKPRGRAKWKGREQGSGCAHWRMLRIHGLPWRWQLSITLELDW